MPCFPVYSHKVNAEKTVAYPVCSFCPSSAPLSFGAKTLRYNIIVVNDFKNIPLLYIICDSTILS